jgi:hypothetical protein
MVILIYLFVWNTLMLLNVFTVYKEGFTKRRYKQHFGHADNLIQLCLGYELTPDSL